MGVGGPDIDEVELRVEGDELLEDSVRSDDPLLVANPQSVCLVCCLFWIGCFCLDWLSC